MELFLFFLLLFSRCAAQHKAHTQTDAPGTPVTGAPVPAPKKPAPLVGSSGNGAGGGGGGGF